MDLLPAYILIGVGLIIVGWLLTRKFLNPLTIFITIWVGIVLLYNLQLSKLQRPINDQTYITLIVCIVSFALAFLLTPFTMLLLKHIKHAKKKNSTEEKRLEKPEDNRIDAVGEFQKKSGDLVAKSFNVKQKSPAVRKINVWQKIEVEQVDSDSLKERKLKKNENKMNHIDKPKRMKKKNRKSAVIMPEKTAKKPVIIQDVKAPIKKRGELVARIVMQDVIGAKEVAQNYPTMTIEEFEKMSGMKDAQPKPELRHIDENNIGQKSQSMFQPIKQSEKVANKSRKKTKRSIITFRLILILFLIWFVIEVFEVIYSGGVPIMWKLLESSKTYFDFGIPSVHGMMNAMGLVIITLAMYLYESTRKNDHKRNFWLIGIIGVMLGFYCVILTRQVMISAVLQIIVMKLLFVSKKSWWKVAIFGVAGVICGVLAFGVLGNLRTGYDDFLRVSEMKEKPSKALSGPLWVYMYLTMTVANVNEFVGLGINDLGFEPILRNRLPGALDGIVSFGDKNRIRYLVVNAYNASGFFNDYYLGYGNSGVAVIAALYGLLGGYFWIKFQTKRSARYMIYYAIYLQLVLLSFFTDYLVFLADGSQFIIVYLIFKIGESKFIQKRKIKKMARFNAKTSNNVKNGIISEQTRGELVRLLN